MNSNVGSTQGIHSERNIRPSGSLKEKPVICAENFDNMLKSFKLSKNVRLLKDGLIIAQGQSVQLEEQNNKPKNQFRMSTFRAIHAAQETKKSSMSWFVDSLKFKKPPSIDNVLQSERNPVRQNDTGLRNMDTRKTSILNNNNKRCEFKVLNEKALDVFRSNSSEATLQQLTLPFTEHAKKTPKVSKLSQKNTIKHGFQTCVPCLSGVTAMNLKREKGDFRVTKM